MGDESYRIMLQREDPGASLLGNILQFQFPHLHIVNPIAAIHRTFIGKFVPIEVFQVNMTALDPQLLCSHLQDSNPGVLQQRVWYL